MGCRASAAWPIDAVDVDGDAAAGGRCTCPDSSTLDTSAPANNMKLANAHAHMRSHVLSRPTTHHHAHTQPPAYTHEKHNAAKSRIFPSPSTQLCTCSHALTRAYAPGDTAPHASSSRTTALAGRHMPTATNGPTPKRAARARAQAFTCLTTLHGKQKPHSLPRTVTQAALDEQQTSIPPQTTQLVRAHTHAHVHNDTS